MRNPEEIKRKFNKSQLLITDFSGDISHSDANLFDDWKAGDNIFEIHPFFEIVNTLKPVHKTSTNEFQFPCVHLESENIKEKICDVTFVFEEEQINILIFDYTTTYQQLNIVSQEKNDSIIKSQELTFSNQLLIEKEKFKNNFIANINHELATPLTSIKGFLEIFEKTELSYEQEELIRIIKSESSYLQSIFRDMLDISRIESGEFSLKNEVFDFLELLQEIEEAHRVITQSKFLDFQVVIDKKINKFVNADKTRLYQIISSLIGNAVKYTESGSVKLEITKLSGRSKKQELEIKVTDTGIGISKENQERIFEPFAQLNDLTEGSGLGLHVTRNLVHLMGGSIYIKSEPNKGSEFKVVLKLNSVTHEESAYIEKDYQLPKGKKYRILVVENRLNTQYLIMKQLLSKGCFFVDAVSNAEDALISLENRNYDLVIADIKLPKTSGLDLAKKIRHKYADNAIKNVAILGLSGVQVPNILNKAIAAGMDYFIPKPYTEVELMKKISRLLLLREKA